MDIAQILIAAQDPNIAVRQPAEAQIEQAKQNNLVRRSPPGSCRLLSQFPRARVSASRAAALLTLSLVLAAVRLPPA